LKCTAKAWPYLDAVVRHVSLLFRIKVAPSNLLKLYLAKQTIEKTFHKRKHITVVILRNALNPLDVDFKLYSIDLSSKLGYLRTVFQTVDASRSQVYEKSEVLLFNQVSVRIDQFFAHAG
jgi:hypothetical protein